MPSDDYLRNILAREQVDISATSPVRTVATSVAPVLQHWAHRYLAAVHPSGSFAKGTANSSNTDIDLFVSLRADVPATLKEMHDTLFNALTQAGFSPRHQNVSLGIKVGYYDVDIVPGKRQSDQGEDHSLYRRRGDTWIKTNVARHIQIVAGSGLTNEIRVLKLWRSQKGLDFPSFYLELAAIEALRDSARSTISNNVVTALTFFRDKLQAARIVDPANTNNIISEDVSSQGKQLIASAARSALNGTWEGCVK